MDTVKGVVYGTGVLPPIEYVTEPVPYISTVIVTRLPLRVKFAVTDILDDDDDDAVGDVPDTSPVQCEKS